MHRIFRSLALLFLCLLLIAPVVSLPALAQDGQATVRLDGRALFCVSPDEETRAEARAERIEQRLQLLLRNPDADLLTVAYRQRRDATVIAAVCGRGS
jgi:hypothetical protein